MVDDVGDVNQLVRFVARVDVLLEHERDEHALAFEVAEYLREMLADGFVMPAEYTQPGEHGYVMHPLHIDAEGRFSVAAAVWDVGQVTPVHSHETWGVVGIYSGTEGETKYVKPTHDGVPLQVAEDGLRWGPGEVTVCCTTDDDIHRVECVGNEPCIGIHVYGADIGSLRRRSYDPSTGEVTWFTSVWEGTDP